MREWASILNRCQKDYRDQISPCLKATVKTSAVIVNEQRSDAIWRMFSKHLCTSCVEHRL